MQYSFNIVDLQARAFGLTTIEDFKKLATGELTPDVNAKNPKPVTIPMMASRRLSGGCRMAVDIGIELCKTHEVDAVIYSSSTGELEHNYKVLLAAAQKQDPSPTDFTMSVHNTGVGNFTILGKKKIPSSSICAGTDSLLMAFVDAVAMLKNGLKKVLVVDYNVEISDFFKNYLPKDFPSYPNAVAFVIEDGDGVTVTSKVKTTDHICMTQSLDFVLNYLKGTKEFTLDGTKLSYDIKVK